MGAVEWASVRSSAVEMEIRVQSSSFDLLKAAVGGSLYWLGFSELPLCLSSCAWLPVRALGTLAPAVAHWVNGHTGGTWHDSTMPAGVPSAGGQCAGVVVSLCMACGTCLLYGVSHSQGSEVPAGLQDAP